MFGQGGPLVAEANHTEFALTDRAQAQFPSQRFADEALFGSTIQQSSHLGEHRLSVGAVGLHPHHRSLQAASSGVLTTGSPRVQNPGFRRWVPALSRGTHL
jgi:hypothetical protein